MESCPTCAEPITKGQRFCPACGSPTQDVELLDPGAAPVVTEQTVTRRSHLDNRWYLALGAVLTVAIGWSIFSSPGSEDAVTNGETEVADSTTTSTTGPETTDDAEPAETTTTSTGAGDAEDDIDESVEPVPSDASVALVGGPIGDSGLTLVTGDPIRFLDLDTGAVIETTHRRLMPIAVIGDRLIVNAETSGSNLKALDLNDLEALPKDFESPNGYLFAFSVGEEPGTILAIGDNYNSGLGLSRYVYDAATGNLLEESPVEFDFSIFVGSIVPGDFMTPRSGGVYRIDGANRQLVGPGRVVAQGGGLVLVEACDEQLECSFDWHDASSYEPISLPIPDQVSDGRVLANGRLLIFRSVDGRASSILDLESGEIVATELEDISGWATSVSPNDKMVAYSSAGVLKLLDIDSGEEFEVRIEDQTRARGQLLIETR